MRWDFALCFAGNKEEEGELWWEGEKNFPPYIHVHSIPLQDDGCSIPILTYVFILTHAFPALDWLSKWLEHSTKEAKPESLPIGNGELHGHILPQEALPKLNKYIPNIAWDIHLNDEF